MIKKYKKIQTCEWKYGNIKNYNKIAKKKISLVKCKNGKGKHVAKGN